MFGSGLYFFRVSSCFGVSVCNLQSMYLRLGILEEVLFSKLVDFNALNAAWPPGPSDQILFTRSATLQLLARLAMLL
jgi:hypothetical protein